MFQNAARAFDPQEPVPDWLTSPLNESLPSVNLRLTHGFPIFFQLGLRHSST